GVGFAQALGVSSGGAAVGFSRKYSGDTILGTRAVRWPVGQTAPIELGHLDNEPGQGYSGQANAINSTGDTVGWAYTESGNGTQTDRAVLWRAAQTAAQALPGLPLPAGQYSDDLALAINNAGVIVG